MDSPANRQNSRVFIDSSVLLAAALSASGSARDLLLATDASGIELFTSNLVFEETSRNLRARYPSV
jgi:predicted nucleic acid-binding protein